GMAPPDRVVGIGGCLAPIGKMIQSGAQAVHGKFTARQVALVELIGESVERCHPCVTSNICRFQEFTYLWFVPVLEPVTVRIVGTVEARYRRWGKSGEGVDGWESGRAHV